MRAEILKYLPCTPSPLLPCSLHDKSLTGHDIIGASLFLRFKFLASAMAIFNPVRYRYGNRPNPLTPFPKREGGTIQSLSPKRREV